LNAFINFFLARNGSCFFVSQETAFFPLPLEGVRSRTLPTGKDGDGRKADLPLTASASATMGDQGPNSLRFSPPAEGGEVREESNLVGVGIVFQPVEDGTLYVKRMREDSPAARSGLIQIGDCLCEVNGRCARPSARPQNVWRCWCWRPPHAGLARRAALSPCNVACDRAGCRDVFRQPTDVVKALLLGPPGTTVRLGFHRGTDPNAPLIQVALQRLT